MAPVTITFDGSLSSDANGDPLSFAWDFDDGSMASVKVVSHSFVAGGIYSVKLTVSDNRGGTGVHYVMITVNADNPVNAHPMANMLVSPRGKFAPVTMTADASASSDADGDALSYEWIINGNQTATGPIVTWTAAQPGTYVFFVGVEDGRGGASNINSGGVLVRDSGEPACKMEVSDFGSSFAATVYLSNYGTAPTNGWQVWWQFPAGVTVNNPFNANVAGSNPYIASSLTYNGVIQPASWISFGFYGQKSSSAINLQGTEVMGAICDNKTPPPANHQPVAALTASPTSGPAPLNVRVDASGSSDPDGDPLTYTWNWGDGSAPITLTSPVFNHLYQAGSSGTRNLSVTVNDQRGGTATKSILITIQ